MDSSPTFEFCAALASGLAGNGVRHAAVSPGSRNTPLLIALAAEPEIELSTHFDERSGGFFALGMAKATGRPTVLCCTSGTAATEYLPAVTEARMAHTPLIVLTADRPPELQDRGAAQTIDQRNLYGSAAKWFFDTGVPGEPSTADAAHIARQAVMTANDAPAGPVHLNVPLREPLVPDHPVTTGSHGGGKLPVHTRAHADEPTLNDMASMVGGRSVAIVAGATRAGVNDAAIIDLAAALGAIVIADPQSAVRFGGAAPPGLISLADLLISAELTLPAPEVILHFGPIHTSKAINRWMRDSGASVVHIHDGNWHDPLGIAEMVVVADPSSTAAQLAKIVQPGPSDFAPAWRDADDRAIEVASSALASGAADSEPAAAVALLDAMPWNGVLFAGSSMPIRLIDSYGVRRDRPARVFANRGANGIDGSIATSLGIAAATGAPTFSLIGDLTALADIGSLVAVAAADVPLTIVAINNDGGGIFDFLPQADPDRVPPEVYREHIVVPHGIELAPLAAGFGVASRQANPGELAEMIHVPSRGPRFIEVKVPAGAGPASRSAIVDAVAAMWR